MLCVCSASTDCVRVSVSVCLYGVETVCSCGILVQGCWSNVCVVYCECVVSMLGVCLCAVIDIGHTTYMYKWTMAERALLFLVYMYEAGVRIALYGLIH